MRWNRGASTMASAVPQLPPPTIVRWPLNACSRRRRVFRAEKGLGRLPVERSTFAPEDKDTFGPGVQTAHILLMPVNNEGARDQGRRQHRPGGMQDQPDRQRKCGRGDDGTDRNVARDRYCDHKYRQNGGEWDRSQAQERPHETRHGFAALELQKYRE